MYNRFMSESLIWLAAFGENILQNLGKWNVIFGIALMVLALVSVFSVKPIVESLRFSDNKKDKVILSVRIIAVIAAFGGALAVCF